MKRIETQKCYTQIVLLPTFGFVRRDCGVYDYKYRIAFAWLFWRLSIGLWQGRTSHAKIAHKREIAHKLC